MREVDPAPRRHPASRRTRRAICEVDRESIGYVFQDATLLPWRTVQRNVELIAELHHVPRPSAPNVPARRSNSSVSTATRTKHPKQLSGGMKMRCSLARSLVMDPKVFLFDEPFGALDEISRERLNDELLQPLHRRRQFAGLFITHSIAEAVFMSTRVLVMSGRPGRILADIEVPFEYRRRPELRYEPAFAELSGRVSEHLKEAHG